MQHYHLSMKMLSRSTRSTPGALAYRAGVDLEDQRTGETFKYANKNVTHVELVVTESSPQWVKQLARHIDENRASGVQRFGVW